MNEKVIAPLSLPLWLFNQESFPRFYYRSKDGSEEIAACGALEEFSTVPHSPLKRVYGATFFPGDSSDDLWEDFPACYFFSPLYEIRQSPYETTLRFTKSLPDLSLPREPPDPKIDCFSMQHTPEKELFAKQVKQVLSKIEKNELEKLVLARRTSATIDAEPAAILLDLIKRSKNCAIFAFQMSPSAIFLGASPERLFERKGRRLITESIAGTRKKMSLEEDTTLKAELLQSIKDQKEVHFVRDFLQRKLSTLCESFSFDQDLSCLETSTLIHLYSRFEGVLQEGTTDAKILSALHPTPAVAGLSTQKALQTLSTLEPFHRGLYAGALGYLCQKSASFTVAIRSALIKKNTIYMFTGAGIVEGSDPIGEWNELSAKLSPWMPLCKTFP